MHHGLGSIVVANGNFSSESKQTKAVPRNKKQSWSTVDFNEGIQIREYIAPDKPALKQTFLRPIIQEKFHNNFSNLIWNCSRIFLRQCPNWAGYMSTKLTNQTLRKSLVTMLPIINVSATDTTALHLLLCFVNIC